MALFISFFIRLIAISFGLFIAYLMAGAFYVLAVLFGMDLLDGFSGGFDGNYLPVSYNLSNTEDIERLISAAIAALQTIAIGASLTGKVLLASVIAIAIGELQSWRGLVTNLLLGGAIALFAGFSTIEFEIKQAFLIVLLGTGFVGGFFYWLIAGRSAGKWLESPKPDQNDDGAVHIEN